MRDDAKQVAATAASKTEAGDAIADSVLALGAGQVVTTLCAILFNGLLARTIGSSEFATYFLIVSITMFAFVFVDWGQATLVVAEAARRPDRAGVLLGTCLLFRAVSAIILMLLLYLLALLMDYAHSVRTILVLYFAASLPFSFAQAYGLIFQGLGRTRHSAVLAILNKLAILMLGAFALVLGGHLLAITVVQLVAGSISLIVAHSAYARLGLPRLNWCSDLSTQLWSAGAAILALTSILTAQQYLDALILSKLAPQEALGWFGAARIIMGTLVAPAVILSTAALPQLSIAARAPEAFGEMVRTSLRALILIGGLASACTYLTAEPAIALIYGNSSFEPAAAIIKVFSPTIFLVYLDILLGRALVLIGRAKSFVVLKSLTVALGVALDFALIPHFQLHHGNGALGLVASMLICECLVFIGAVALLPRGTLQIDLAYLILKVVVATIASIVFANTLNLYGTIVEILAAGFSFTCVALLLRALTPDDFKFVVTSLRRGIMTGKRQRS